MKLKAVVMVYLSFNITSDRYTSTAKYVNTLSAKGEKKRLTGEPHKGKYKKSIGNYCICRKIDRFTFEKEAVLWQFAQQSIFIYVDVFLC